MKTDTVVPSGYHQGGATSSAIQCELINILIVDDDSTNLTVLETILDDPSYRLVRAQSADEALRALVMEEFALLILDIRMPDMSGFELANLIKRRKKTSRVPIIFLTAYYTEDQHMLEAYGSGAVDYLHKPVNPPILRSKVAVFAELHRKTCALTAEVHERRRAEEQLQELNDVLEQRVAERTEALRRSERELADFFEQATIGLHWIGSDGTILKVNRTELELLGYSREEYVGHPIAQFHVDQSAIQDMLDRLAHGETLHDYPSKIRCKNGAIRDVLISSNVFFEEGKFVHSRCFTRDVTDRKQAEDALKESEERFRTLADNISQFAWMGDGTGWITWYNRRWYDYTGMTFEEMEGWGWQQVLHPDHLQRVVKKWQQAIDAGEPWEDTFPLRGLDGTYRWFLSRALPIPEAEGRVFRWFGTNTDITELRNAQTSLLASEEQLICQKSALVESNKELEGFSYSVSHDLRAPLRTINAFSRIIEEEHGSQLNADVQRSLGIIRQAACHAGELIDDLLEFSRVGRQGMTFRSVKMADLARGTAGDLISVQEGRRIDLIIGDLPDAYGDPRFLKLVWNNLLTNALKYSGNRNESRIEVGWMLNEKTEQVTYYVKDNGVGFDMKYVHKLFGVFQRLHRAEEFEGSGVGLAIVQRIVQRHGGRVWAEGKVNTGATFYFSLQKAAI